jgi:hypothetical protein
MRSRTTSNRSVVTEDLLKSILAFTWHSADYALDHYDAPRNMRRGVAGIGILWSAFWLGSSIIRYATHKDLVETDRQIAAHFKSHSL